MRIRIFSVLPGACGKTTLEKVLKRQTKCRADGEEQSLPEPGDEAWHDVMIQSIANEATVPETRVRNALRREAYLTDALLYVQLGNPERVIIAKPYDDQKRSVAAAGGGVVFGSGH